MYLLHRGRRADQSAAPTGTVVSPVTSTRTGVGVPESHAWGPEGHPRRLLAHRSQRSSTVPAGPRRGLREVAKRSAVLGLDGTLVLHAGRMDAPTRSTSSSPEDDDYAE